MLCVFLVVDLDRFEERHLAETRNELSNLSRVFAEEVHSSVHVIDLTLIDLRERWLADPQDFPALVLRRQALLQSNMAFQVAIINASGIMVFSSLDPGVVPLDLSDREHFQVHRDGKGDDLFTSKPVLGRVSNAGRSSSRVACKISKAIFWG